MTVSLELRDRHVTVLRRARSARCDTALLCRGVGTVTNQTDHVYRYTRYGSPCPIDTIKEGMTSLCQAILTWRSDECVSSLGKCCQLD